MRANTVGVVFFFFKLLNNINLKCVVYLRHYTCHIIPRTVLGKKSEGVLYFRVSENAFRFKALEWERASKLS